MMKATRRSLIAIATGLVLVGTGCSTALGPTSTQVSSHTLALMGAPTSETEREARIERGDGDDGINEDATKSAFWGGVIVGSVGVGMGIAGGTIGAATESQLTKGYTEEGLDRPREDQLTRRGAAANAITITGASVAVAGLITAAVAYGIDHTRCGKMRRKREGCSPN